MELVPEIVYPLFLVACVDRYPRKQSLLFVFYIFYAHRLQHDEMFTVSPPSSHEPVIKRGEELLKKKASGVNLEDQSLINRLYLLFNGMQIQNSNVIFCTIFLHVIKTLIFCLMDITSLFLGSEVNVLNLGVMERVVFVYYFVQVAGFAFFSP